MSRRTSGSAFSLIVKLADVCWIKRLHMPIEILAISEPAASWISEVMRWQPREGALTEIERWNQSICGMLSDAEGVVLLSENEDEEDNGEQEQVF